MIREKSLAYKVDKNGKKSRAMLRQDDMGRVNSGYEGECVDPDEVNWITEVYLPPVFEFEWFQRKALEYAYIEDVDVGTKSSFFRPTLYITRCDLKELFVNIEGNGKNSDLRINLVGNPNLKILKFPTVVDSLYVDAPVYYNQLKGLLIEEECNIIEINYDY